ncbi:hypothetical protein L3073_17415 [Ancylomarina sp. DW003]|nr:hypothetical protein [Ancylomarina sp. DW003]MDE5423997.1 hypothetical protein [Ancylomarina sp. DW003]
MKKIMHLLFLSCLKASELIEKDFHIKLGSKERLQLKLHKTMCDTCNRYSKHSAIIEKAIHDLQDKEAIFVDFKKLEKRIILNLKNA